MATPGALSDAFDGAQTVPAALRHRVEVGMQRTALRFKKYGLWHDVSWERYQADVERLACGLLELGLAQGDRVAIIGENCYEWLQADLAIQCCGGVAVGLYTTNSWEQSRFILEHSGSRYLFVQNAEQLDKWLTFRDQSSAIERVVVWDMEGLRDFQDPAVLSIGELARLGGESGPHQKPCLNQRIASLRPEHLAVLVYTSGTTGVPKGAMLSHGNVMWAAHSVGSYDPNLQLGPRDELLSFLPLCHIFERLFSVFAHLHCGYVLNLVESPETVVQNLREVSPTLGYGVPRIWEKLASRIELQMRDASWLKRQAYAAAMGVGSSGLPGRSPAGIKALLGEWTVLKKLRERLGLERMKAAVTGAAPISPEVLKFFAQIGLEMIEGYGQTETSGVISGTRVGCGRPGYVGQPVPGLEIRIAEDGEIAVRSPGVFQGYYRDPEKTRQVLDPDGWLRTGDVGELTADGYLRIVDRKKDILITAGGKNIAPQFIENQLKFSPYIYDAVLVGEGRRFLSALIVLDEENVAKFAQDRHIACATYAEMAANRKIQELIRTEIDRVNAQISRVESVRKFRVLPRRLYEEDGEVTPTMKVKRSSICSRYADLVKSMYS